MNRESWYPAGFPWQEERALQRYARVAAALAGFTVFLCQFSVALRELQAAIRAGAAGRTMPPLPALLTGMGAGFLLLALCQGAVAAAHWLYHYQGGRSIYRMRTLPQRRELWRRCLAAPAAELGWCALAALATAALCAACYRLFTPAGLLPAHWLGGA